MKKVGIIGSTGSIGTQALQVIRELNGEEPESFSVSVLACGGNVGLLARQAAEFLPEAVSVGDKNGAEQFRELIGELRPGYKPEVFYGAQGLKKAAAFDQDILLNSVVGMVGIEPTLAAVKKGTDIALANKETLVAAGDIVMREAKKSGSRILPVDSEHSAVFQCLEGLRSEDVESVILTCSGGPFRTYSKERLEEVTLEQALNHPTWKMGGKITVDCATLMNKGLEVIEASRLFGLPVDRVEVAVHPQSIIHSMVRTRDGAVFAQMGVPSMKLPIRYAFAHPVRHAAGAERLDLFANSPLTFEKPDTDRFPCLALAYEAGRTGGTMPACMNAANEKAVSLFFKGAVRFADIPLIVERAMEAHVTVRNPGIRDILATGKETYRTAGEDLLRR